MEVAILVAISLGGLAGLILLIGIIVCVVRVIRQKRLDKDNPYKKTKDSTYEVPPGSLPPPGLSNLAVSPDDAKEGDLVPIKVPMDGAEPGERSNPAGPIVTMVGDQNPVVMNPSSLTGSTSVVAIGSKGPNSGNVILNGPQPQQPVTTVPVSSVPVGVATYSDVLPTQREVLNGSNVPATVPPVANFSNIAVVQPAPIVPQQVQLLYPSLPQPIQEPAYPVRPIQNPTYPGINPTAAFATVPNISSITGPQVYPATTLVQPSSGYLSSAGPGRLTLSGRAFTDPQPQGNQPQVRSDGFTVYPSGTTGAVNPGQG